MIKEDSNKCYETLYHCIYSIINIGNLLEPFLPFSSERLRKIVGVKEISWQPLSVPVGKIGAVDLLFKRLDKSES